jgi:CTP synthase (UTP-ammonia lyase)
MRQVQVGLIGDFNHGVTAHRAIPLALRLAADNAGCLLEGIWIHTTTLGPDVARQLSPFAGLWCVPATPYENAHGALAAIRFAREAGVPFLGTCGGFQHALLEYARNVLGIQDAEHAEEHPETPMPLIAPLSCALVEQAGAIALMDNSQLRQIYRATEAEEEYHCRMV